MQLGRDDFKKEEKKLCKYKYENEIYNRIVTHIKQCSDYNQLKNHPEEMKYDLSGYCSFNLSKK